MTSTPAHSAEASATGAAHPNTGESPFLGAIGHFPLRRAPLTPTSSFSLSREHTPLTKEKNHRDRHKISIQLGAWAGAKPPPPSHPPPPSPGLSGSQSGEITDRSHQAGRRFLYASGPESLENQPLRSSPPRAASQNPNAEAISSESQRPKSGWEGDRAGLPKAPGRVPPPLLPPPPPGSGGCWHPLA